MTKLKKPRKSYADRLMAQGRARKGKLRTGGQECLVGCAVERDGDIHGREAHHRSHSEVRRDLGDENPYNERPGDVCGFLTSKGRFVGRREGSVIAVLAGQAPPMYEDTQIMSCDIVWRKP